MILWPCSMASVSDGTDKDGEDTDLYIEEPDCLTRKDYNDAAYRVMCKYSDARNRSFWQNGLNCRGPGIGNQAGRIHRKLLRLAAELPYVPGQSIIFERNRMLKNRLEKSGGNGQKYTLIFRTGWKTEGWWRHMFCRRALSGPGNCCSWEKVAYPWPETMRKT